MLNFKEGDIDIKLGYFIIPHPKEKRPKLVPMIEQDIEILSKMPRGFPNLYFFRHCEGVSGAIPGSRFGDRYLYKYWKKACLNIGVEGVDLYGGTGHSSVTSLRNMYSPEQIRCAPERFIQQIKPLKDTFRLEQRTPEKFIKRRP